MYLFLYFLYIMSAALARMPAQQKRPLGPITDGCELPCGCWELNPGPLEEQPVLLTAELSLQSHFLIFFESGILLTKTTHSLVTKNKHIRICCV